MNRIITIIISVLIITIIGLSIAVSCQRESSKDKDAQIETLMHELNSMQSEFGRMKSDIENANRRIDDAIQIYAKGTHDAHTNHDERIEALSKIEASNDNEANDWLCEPVPSDVCLLFDEYTGPVHTD